MGYPFFVLYQSHDIGSVRRSIGLVCWEETRSKVNVIGRGKGQGARVVSAPEACIVFVSWNPQQGYDPMYVKPRVFSRVESFGRGQGEDARVVSARMW